MNWIIDRIEGEIALVELENNNVVQIPLVALPSNVKEGNVISVLIDSKETDKRKEKISKMMNDLFID